MYTFSHTKQECWVEGFWVLANERGDEWKERFWKRWDPSIRSARKLGYEIVPVRITEWK